jgi:hypothetical protein
MIGNTMVLEPTATNRTKRTASTWSFGERISTDGESAEACGSWTNAWLYLRSPGATHVKPRLSLGSVKQRAVLAVVPVPVVNVLIVNDCLALVVTGCVFHFVNLFFVIFFQPIRVGRLLRIHNLLAHKADLHDIQFMLGLLPLLHPASTTVLPQFQDSLPLLTVITRSVMRRI